MSFARDLMKLKTGQLCVIKLEAADLSTHYMRAAAFRWLQGLNALKEKPFILWTTDNKESLIFI